MRIDGAGDDLGSDFSELFDAVVEGQDLSRAHEGEGQGVKEEDQVLSLEIGKLQLLQLAVVHRRAWPVRRRLGNHGLGPLQIVAGRLRVGGNGSTWN